MGKHYLLNLYGCSFDLLNDENFLIHLIESAAKLSGATVIQTISKKFEPQGVTCISLLSESHLSAHTWPEKGKALFDCFTCGDCEPRLACELIISKLKPETHTLKFVER
jgi:S-adenosylmethionine decarboxylase